MPLTRASNACSRLRATRNAAFMIMRSPIGFFFRGGADTARGRPTISAPPRPLPPRPGLQRGVDQAPVLHPREVGRTLLRRDLPLEAPDVLVVLLDLADDLVAIPEDLQPELELVLH